MAEILQLEHVSILCQVLSIFVFPRSAQDPIDGCSAFESIVKMCPGLKPSSLLKTSELRKYIANISQVKLYLHIISLCVWNGVSNESPAAEKVRAMRNFKRLCIQKWCIDDWPSGKINPFFVLYMLRVYNKDLQTHFNILNNLSAS